MMIPLLIFVISLAGTAGLYWLVLARQEREDRRLVKARIGGFATPAASRVALDLMKDGDNAAASPPALPLLQRFETFAARQIEQSGLQTTPDTLMWMTCGMTVGPFFLLTLAGHPLYGMGAGVLGAAFPWVRLRRARARRIAAFERYFPEAVDIIARALRAGHALTSGLVMVAEEIPDPVGAEFRILYEHQNYGLPLPEALHQFAQRVPLLDARFFATAVLVQREVGGNLSEVLDNLSSVIRTRLTVKKQVRALTTHGRVTGWVLGMMPLVLGILMALLNPEQARLLIDDPLGIKMLTGAAVLQVVGIFAVRRIVDVEY